MSAVMTASGQSRSQTHRPHRHGTTTSRIGNQFIECFNAVLCFMLAKLPNYPPNDSAYRWRFIRNLRITTWRCGATIRCSAGFGRIPVLGLPGSELKDALPCQPRSQSRYQHAGDDHRACTGRHHNAEVSNLHSAYEFLNTTASIHHPSSGSGSLPRLRSRLQHLPNYDSATVSRLSRSGPSMSLSGVSC